MRHLLTPEGLFGARSVRRLRRGRCSTLSLGPVAGATAYSCSKAAQVALAKMAALELAKDGIRVNVICPGLVGSNIETTKERRHLERAQEPMEFPAGKVPLTDGRPGIFASAGGIDSCRHTKITKETMNHRILKSPHFILIAFTALLPTVRSATAAQCSNTNFGPEARYAVRSYPNSVAVGDFNGDGIKDLAIADAHSTRGVVSVLLGTGAGTFARQSTYSAGPSAGPLSVAIGDFNGDGIQDLATANGTHGTASVFFGNGDGTFGAASQYSVGPNAMSVAVGDFNRDGHPDLVTANARFGDSVSVLLNAGDGTFLPQVTYPMGFRPHSVAVGDFNGDGTLDLVVSNENPQDTVTLRLGTGTGAFGKRSSYATGIAPESVATGDFNGDGKLDLVTANIGSDTVSVLLGTGMGTFKSQSTYPTGIAPGGVAVGDFNGDGKLDLVTANYRNNSASVLLGTGKGTFSPQFGFLVGTQPNSVAVGDFNGDGRLDFVTANTVSNDVSVLLNSCN